VQVKILLDMLYQKHDAALSVLYIPLNESLHDMEKQKQNKIVKNYANYKQDSKTPLLQSN